MPLQSERQVIGYQGELWFRSQLPRGWIPNPPERDIGIDFSVTISENGELDKCEFRVQVKSTEKPRISENSISIRNVKGSTIDYWFKSPIPTLIVVHDQANNVGYYVWHSEIHHQVADAQHSHGGKYKIQVPINNLLDDRGWESIRSDLCEQYRYYRKAFRNLEKSGLLNHVIHSLAAAAKELNNIEHQPISQKDMRPDQYEFLAAREIVNHKKVVSELNTIRNQLIPDSPLVVKIDGWLETYKSDVSFAFPNFNDFLEHEELLPDFAIAFIRSRAHEKRFQLIQHVLAMIMFLAPDFRNFAEG